MADKVYHQISVEIEEDDIKAMLRDYEVPVTAENIEDCILRITDDLESDIQTYIENAVQSMADDG